MGIVTKSASLGPSNAPVVYRNMFLQLDIGLEQLQISRKQMLDFVETAVVDAA
jgi:hypothetical protein